MMQRLPILVAGLLAVIVASLPAEGDLAFQAVDEWTILSFRYPSGRARLLSEGLAVSAFDRGWSDTTGRGIPFDRYFSVVDAAGDSIGYCVWENLPPGKYFFVETLGSDSAFVLPDYFRAGFDLAPPASVDSNAVLDGMIQTRHLDPDSLIDDPKFIKSGVIRNSHLAPNIDGAKLLPGTVTESALEAGAALANLTAGGATAIVSSSGASGGLNVETNLVVGDSATIGGIFTANSDTIYLNNTPGERTYVRGDLITQDDMVFGTAVNDTAGFRGPAWMHDSLRVAASFAEADSNQWALHLADGFLAGHDIARRFTMPTGSVNKRFLWEGVTSDCDCLVQEEHTSPHATGWSCYAEDGGVRVRKTASVLADRTIKVWVICNPQPVP